MAILFNHIKIRFFSPILLVLMVLLSTFYSNSILAQKKIITFAENDWASQQVLTHVIGHLFNNYGYDVEYQKIAVIDQWGALSQGIIDIQLSVWQGTMSSKAKTFLTNKRIIDAGNHLANTREEWWFPSYLKAKCPQLPDWHALVNCRYLFLDNKTQRPTFYTGNWGNDDILRIRALKLPFEVKRLGDEDKLWQKLQSAYQQKQGIVLLNWRPNWTDSKLKGEFIEFPKFDDACLSNNSWGINPHLTHDCGSPTKAWIKKVVSHNFVKHHACLFNKIKQIQFTNKMIADAAALKKQAQQTLDKIAKNWIKQYPVVWQKWLHLSC
ncbi:MAG: glycine/betaine ABC transporter substrate-binding protein [Gammaproteobacteria bacterium]|nr:MAG: glycine/betaine ABC transporter substrate-binding protein [Gammaproteobacteria bacterium]